MSRVAVALLLAASSGPAWALASPRPSCAPTAAQSRPGSAPSACVPAAKGVVVAQSRKPSSCCNAEVKTCC